MVGESSELEQRRDELTRPLAALSETPQPVSDLPVTPRAVDAFDHRRLFLIPLDRPRSSFAAGKPPKPPTVRARGVATRRQNGEGHRYCSGCAQDTEHVVSARGGPGRIPSIRWPADAPVGGTTICVNCGEPRAAGARGRPPSWSAWPRARTAPRHPAAAPRWRDASSDRDLEAAPENEGMPTQPEATTSASTPAGQRRAGAALDPRSA